MNRGLQLAISYIITALCLSACVAITPAPVVEEAIPSDATNAEVHWSYEGESGPDEWGELSPDYALCGDGTSQSPIDVAQLEQSDLVNIVFSYQPSALHIVNNGHTIQVNYDEGSYIEVDGVRYDLLQFHFHAPSEHLIDGQPNDAELHLVHKSAEGATAVVGLLLQQGEVENVALKPVFDNLPQEEGPVQTIDEEIRADLFLPMGKATFRYSGSLTTPPCTEGVNWLLLTLPVEISTEQLAALTAIIDGNNRPEQLLHERLVTEDTTP